MCSQLKVNLKTYITTMFLILLCITGLLATSTASGKPNYDLEKAEALFEEFMKTYGKTYSNNAEQQKRLEIFKQNLKSINEKNSGDGAVFGINKFSDLTEQEFRRTYLGHRPHASVTACKQKTDSDVTTNDAPDAFDWRTKGVVAPVQDQGLCGSCWAFSTIGNIEGQYAIKTTKLEKLSEQEVVDCSKSNMGCGGGMPENAMTDLMNLGGLELESDYPYEGKNKECRFDKAKVKVQLEDCVAYNLTDENKLKELLFKQGPISIGVDGDAVQQYHKGILTLDNCPADSIDHAVLLVGYGSENGNDYWLVKNSWAADWGEQGYFRMHRGDNTCGLLNQAITTAIV